MHVAYDKMLDLINESALPLESENNNYSELINKIGNARFVLMGEASHGTHEFYQARIEITKALIEQKRFKAIAIEGDWPDTYEIHRYLQGKYYANHLQTALAHFSRFPTWMWRNQTMTSFLEWLREYNDKLPLAEKIGFYGMDLYSLNRSMQAVIDYLSKVDVSAAQAARKRYSCFDHLNLDPQTYGYLTNMGMKKDCINEVLDQFHVMQRHALEYIKRDGNTEDEYFYAEQNARLVKNAEHYYRSMFEGHVESWNIRDQHMAETVNAIADYLVHRYHEPAKIIIWAHNSHIGDARATEMGQRGETNIGELIRERYPLETYTIGFSTYQGTVTAATNWDEEPQCKNVNPGLDGSCEELLHRCEYKNFILDLHNPQLEHYLKIPRLQRAIGVVYRPDTERGSHYFFSQLPYQFDAIIHFDETTAVQPM